MSMNFSAFSLVLSQSWFVTDRSPVSSRVLTLTLFHVEHRALSLFFSPFFKIFVCFIKMHCPMDTLVIQLLTKNPGSSRATFCVLA